MLKLINIMQPWLPGGGTVRKKCRGCSSEIFKKTPKRYRKSLKKGRGGMIFNPLEILHQIKFLLKFPRVVHIPFTLGVWPMKSALKSDINGRFTPKFFKNSHLTPLKDTESSIFYDEHPRYFFSRIPFGLGSSLGFLLFDRLVMKF